MKKSGIIVLIGIVGIAASWFALLVGWWWSAPMIGLLFGLFLRPATVSFLASICVGGFSWGLPLAIMAMNAPVKGIANAVESVAGLSSTGGAAIIVLTVLLGCILCVVGTWVGLAIRMVAH